MQPFRRVYSAVASVTRILRDVSDWVAKFPSMAFGVAYLVAVPLFAALYTLAPNDFYDATARYEPTVRSRTQAIANRIRNSFLTAADQNTVGHPLLNGGAVRASRGGVFPIFLIQPEPDHIRIVVRMLATDAPGIKDPFVNIALDFDDSATLDPVQPKVDTTSWNTVKQTLVYVRMRPQVLTDEEVQTSSLFPCKRQIDKACLQMTMDDYSELLSLMATAAGRPTAAQTSYVRMLYFSAVTMSTLGYGDIAPVTTWSRLVVTFQVVLGPILFGLFLNSLTKERQTKPTLSRSIE
jgi:hypothetical protein